MTRTLILTKYHLASLWNWRSVYLSRLIEPVAYFAFLVAGISGMLSAGASSDYALYALTGIFCLLTFRVFTFTVADVSNDRKWGVYAIFTMQGGTTSSYLVSIMIVSTLVFLIQAATLLAVYAGIYGWNMSGWGSAGFVSRMCVAAVVSCGWAGLGAAIGALVDSYSTRDMISTLTSLPIVLSAPLFYTLDSAPKYLGLIARVNPLTYHVYWIRDGGPVSFGCAFAWAAVCFVVGALALRRSDRVSSER